METNQVSNIVNIDSQCNVHKRPRGTKLPDEFMGKAKIQEGKNTLSAVAKAYGVHKSALSEVIADKRNTRHLIQVLETEYGMSIADIRDIWKRKKEHQEQVRASAEKLYFENLENHKGE